MAQGRGDFLGYLASANQVAGTEGDGRDAGVAASAVLFAQRREIHVSRNLLPRTGAHGNFRARRRGADAHRIERAGVQVVGNKFVVALKVEVAHVEVDDAVARVGAFAQDFDRAAMALEERA